MRRSRPFDSGTNVKAEAIGDLVTKTTWTNGSDGARLVAAWGEQISFSGYSINDAPDPFNTTERQIFNGVYTEHMLTGLKIQITPGQNWGSNAQIVHIYQVKMGTLQDPIINGNDMTENRFKMMKDYGSKSFSS